MSAAPGRRPVTLRAVLIGLFATVVLCGLTPYNDFRIAATYIAGNHMPIGSFFLLALLVLGVNVVLRAVRPGWALQPGELLTIWAMTAVSSGLPSSGLFRYLTPHIIAGLHYATPENHWDERILSQLPVALQIRDPAAVRFFFDGLHGRGAIPWGLWLRPMLVYGVFSAALFTVFLCLGVVLRRQWVEHERFTFPIAQLPVEMVREPESGALLPPLFRSTGMWATVVILTIIHTFNGMHQVYSAVPQVGLYQWHLEGLVGRGWKTWNWVRLSVYPLTVGFSYFISNEVLLSLWLFYALFRAELAILDACGVQWAGPGAGYGYALFSSQQAAGAALALTVWVFFTGRGHFGRVLARLWRRTHEPGEREEGLGYRAAVVGFLAGVAVMLAWLVRFGGSYTMAASVLVFSLVSFVTLTWLVAQAGLLFVQPVWAGRELAVRLGGSRMFSPRSILVGAEVEHIFGMDLREFVLPHVMNVQKASDPLHTSRRGLFLAMALALVAGYVVSAYATIRLPYDYGAEVGLNNPWTYKNSPMLPLQFLDSLLTKPMAASTTSWWGVIGGGVGMWAVMVLRANVPWFRLHPAGFIIASGYPLSCFWFSFLLGWLLKNAILKAGGLRLYRRARPIFLGLVVGDCLNGGLWVILSPLLHVRYQILPG
ncbi:MAG: hypothetical protein HYU66_06285 [Armatimonadetes bacterium]|nr:hypothetical protein [Armatimonadota bacterium]